MSGNRNLNSAKIGKKDEFYTQLTDIEKEMRHYRKHFKGKTVLCNCDDPFESNFFKYFVLNFNRLGLRKLIATCYYSSPIAGQQLQYYFDKSGQMTFGFGDELPQGTGSKRPYKAVITTVYDKTGDGGVDMFDVAELFKTGENKLTELNGDGDFNSPECIELLGESDIVVTNPPFSKFRDYVKLLIDNDKSFIIIGHINAIKYSEIFPLIQHNKLWPGYEFNKTMEFIMPDEYKVEGKGYVDADGKKHGFVPGIAWFTNLDIKKRHEEMILVKRYTPEEYPHFDNYNAIEVGKTKDIPLDYDGVMGVPITFLADYNPDQFELLGVSSAMSNEDSLNLHKDYSQYIGYKQNGQRNGRTGSTFGNAPVIEKDDGKAVYYEYNGRRVQATYARLFIRNKHPEQPKGGQN